MRYTSAAAVAAFATVASAKNYNVEVGDDNQNAFSPSHLDSVQKGDTISFKLYQTHNVVQGDFDSPCKASSSGFDSGAVWGGSSKSNPDYFVVTVNDTNPIYAYCSEPGHCAQGMVFAINAPSSGNTYAKYASAAKDTSPGDATGGDAVSGGVFSSQQGGSGSSSSGSSSSASASSSASRQSSSAAASSSSSAASSSAAAASSSSSSSMSAASSTTSGSPSSTSAAAPSSSAPSGGAAGLEANQGLATMAVLGLASLMSWFM